MPTIGVIHQDEDAFVRDWVLPPLPALGFDRALVMPAAVLRPPALEQCAAIVVVAGASAEATEFVTRSRVPALTVLRADPSALADLPPTGTPTIDVRALAERSDLWRRLPWLLQEPGRAADDDLAAEVLTWDDGAFSVLLDEATARDDAALAAELVERFERCARQRTEPSPDAAVRADLLALRSRRQFGLMRRCAAAAIATGTADPTVRRQYAQALVELKEFAAADDVLESLIADTPDDHVENREARGLVGRANKQRYVDSGTPTWLMKAITAYWSVFAEDREALWHGVNAASCLRRATRDRVVFSHQGDVLPLESSETIARSVLTTLAGRRAATGALTLWDCATEVEALLDLGEDAAAEHALTAYVTHPDIRPFEASSTYRQFDEVLRIGTSPSGRRILDRLLDLAIRLRGGGRLATAGAVAGGEAKRFLVRVSDPDWTSGEVPDLVLGDRLGTVVSIGGTARTIKALLMDPLVISVEESRPAAGPDADSTLPFVRVCDEYRWEHESFAERGAGALVAMVDNGIDVMHETFRAEDGTTRIVGIWDQADTSAGPSPDVPFGRLHSADDIARYLREGRAPDTLARRGAHGTHVTSIAAGRPCGGFAGGVAPLARLLVVIAASGQPTGYSDAHIAALAFIDRTATALGLPVVVNVSQGMNAGGHDGVSALEAGFDAFCESGRKPGRVVVKSAGNERDKRGHAKVTVPPGGADDLRWRCPPDLPRRVRLELWWDAANTYRFQLRSPAGDCSEWVERRRQVAEDYFPGQGEYLLELAPVHVDNGSTLLRIEFGCGAGGDDGRWSLAIEADKVRKAGDIHAWVERDAGPMTEFEDHVVEEMTLSVPGTARSILTVGAVAGSTPVRGSVFSSYGPTRDGREKPDLCAPGVCVPGASSGSGTGTVTDSGTSFAAPHVTGAIALVLSRAVACGAPVPTASQVRELLIENTMFRNVFWDRAQGYGVLDVKALLETGMPSMI